MVWWGWVRCGEVRLKIKMNKQKLEKKARNKAMKEWRLLVKKINGDKCVICGSSIRVNCHHIIPKEFHETRYEGVNGITLCPKHHKFGKFSAHKNGLWFIDWLLGNQPNRYEYLTTQIKQLINKYGT